MMPTEEESDSISTRTRSQSQQNIVTLQKDHDSFYNSSSSSTSSGLGGFEDSDIEQTEQYNPRALQFSTTDDTMAPSTLPFDADMIYILEEVLDCNITITSIVEIAEALIQQGATKWTDFKYQDPGDVPSWTYPVRNNNHSNLTNVSVAKLQLFFNYIEIHDHDDAKSYKKTDFEVYFKESRKLRRDTSAAARAAKAIATATGTTLPSGPGNNNSNTSQRYVDPDLKELDDWIRTKRSMEDSEVLKTGAHYPTWKHVFNAKAEVQGEIRSHISGNSSSNRNSDEEEEGIPVGPISQDLTESSW